MGFFYESHLRPEVEDAIRRAETGATRGPGDADSEIARIALLHGSAHTQEIQWSRLVIALGLVGALALGGVIADAFSLEKSTEAFWGLATAAFGIIVGLLGGEKAGG
jgi:hypothetical protein